MRTKTIICTAPTTAELRRTLRACEWHEGCRRKVAAAGHHWGSAFGLCGKAVSAAKQWYVVDVFPKKERA